MDQQTPDGDEKHQLASSVSSDEGLDDPTTNPNDTDDQKAKGGKSLAKAADEIENDLNELAAVIQQASKAFTEKNHHDEEESDQSDKDLHKKPTFDEDDDTSKQATQNYDLHDTEKEVGIIRFYFTLYSVRTERERKEKQSSFTHI